MRRFIRELRWLLSVKLLRWSMSLVERDADVDIMERYAHLAEAFISEARQKAK